MSKMVKKHIFAAIESDGSIQLSMAEFFCCLIWFAAYVSSIGSIREHHLNAMTICGPYEAGLSCAR